MNPAARQPWDDMSCFYHRVTVIESSSPSLEQVSLGSVRETLTCPQQLGLLSLLSQDNMGLRTTQSCTAGSMVTGLKEAQVERYPITSVYITTM